MSNYLKYHSPRWVVKNSLKTIVGTIWGGLFHARLFRKNKYTHYIVVPWGIGDTLCALAYLREYRRQQNLPHVTIVVCSSAAKQICAFYADVVDDVLCISKYARKSLFCFARSYFGQILCAYYHRERITYAYYDCDVMQRAVWDNPYLSLPNFIKNLCYQIGPDAEIEPPHISQMDLTAKIERYGIEKGKTVLFNPYANTIKAEQNRFERLLTQAADMFLRKGFKVFTVTANEEQAPIAGTQALPCSLSEAFHLAEYGGTVIALRSGFLDLMAFAKCRIIAIDDDDYGRKEFFKLEKWGVNDDCHTICYKDGETTLRQMEELFA